MRNLFGRRKGQCRLFVCYWCSFTVCRRFILPREIINDECPMCEVPYWYKGDPVWVDIDKSDCQIQFCSFCNGSLCSCTIDSLLGICPLCGLSDGWAIIPPEFFQ